MLGEADIPLHGLIYLAFSLPKIMNSDYIRKTSMPFHQLQGPASQGEKNTNFPCRISLVETTIVTFPSLSDGS